MVSKSSLIRFSPTRRHRRAKSTILHFCIELQIFKILIVVAIIKIKINSFCQLNLQSFKQRLNRTINSLIK
ncbi:unnamed protein product [Rotaria sp. Silwood2]|nr:unnamed protein product [Rotaria sp. Silwood2]CAF2858882.1 unnamed protein product [Rotaria sp. Silwood2]CAF3281725.1 unnamed protein product [Rotaria sp. Silwood2]CAF3409522.1 unnamed protein product [Rotaria sp. Silwood2]CAF4151692.1 unnamed protein product [Rotaria sp. Silwood2]